MLHEYSQYRLKGNTSHSIVTVTSEMSKNDVTYECLKPFSDYLLNLVVFASAVSKSLLC